MKLDLKNVWLLGLWRWSHNFQSMILINYNPREYGRNEIYFKKFRTSEDIESDSIAIVFTLFPIKNFSFC